jgi:hypothetical protein
MPTPRYCAEEFSRRGHDWYERKIRAQVDTPENFGKRLIINIETGEYEMGSDAITPTDRLLAKDPEAQLFGMKIGFPAAAKRGGAWPSSLKK